MNREIHSPSWKAWSAIVGAIAAIFAVLVIALTLQSRSEIQQQILDRDGHVLTAVARMLQATDNPGLPPPDDLDIALQTSRLRGVFAVRLFDANGDFSIAIPFDVIETSLAEKDLASLQQGQPVTRYNPRADPGEITEMPSNSTLTDSIALQEIVIPLHDKNSNEVIAFIQYLIDGRTVEEEFAALDRTFFFQVGIALAFGLLGLVALAALAFAHLRRSHQALAQQTARLIQANQELSLAARTSAVGAVSSHLIHGIRNALANVHFFAQLHKEERSAISPEDWQELDEATSTIRTLVDDVVEILRDQDQTTSFELSLEELEAVLREKVAPKAAITGAHFETRRMGDAQIPGHTANILLLILMNLIENALSVTLKGRKVWVTFTRRDSNILFEVGDEGPGISKEMQPKLFTPGKSGRSGGSGLGLAISHRLAANINADLKLARSSETGTVFHIHCPLEATGIVSSKNFLNQSIS